MKIWNWDFNGLTGHSPCLGDTYVALDIDHPPNGGCSPAFPSVSLPCLLSPVLSFHLLHCTPTSVSHVTGQQICTGSRHTTKEQRVNFIFYRLPQCSIDFQEPPQFPLGRGGVRQPWGTGGNHVTVDTGLPTDLTLSLLLSHFQSHIDCEGRDWGLGFQFQTLESPSKCDRKVPVSVVGTFYSLWVSLVWRASVGLNDNSRTKGNVPCSIPKYQQEVLQRVHGRHEFYIEVDWPFWFVFHINGTGRVAV